MWLSGRKWSTAVLHSHESGKGGFRLVQVESRSSRILTKEVGYRCSIDSILLDSGFLLGHLSDDPLIRQSPFILQSKDMESLSSPRMGRSEVSDSGRSRASVWKWKFSFLSARQRRH